MNTIIQAKHLSFQQGNKQLLTDINFTIGAGELVGIIGPNGAGKSTLLKCLAGYLTSSSGEIFLKEKTLSSYRHQQRAQHMSYLPQHTEPAFAFLVKDVIGYGRYSHSNPISDKEFNRTIHQLNIEKLLNQPLNQLSGGEQQRVHFARLLLQNADCMLLDEPTASLDIGHESELMNILAAQCQQGKTALVAIHNLNTALEFCDQLLLLQQGELIAFDTPDNVLTPSRLHQLYQDNITICRHPESDKLYLTPRKK
ncbi:ABC transporter ATP-binding protein [Photobacterium angustum]|uniref:Iron ABC transporter n=1 Tax=Photobacterium angustum TaxID=661 RepID=A0A2S7W379_PHOAN|nr:ABC transporter ATP-binding protein [Photobacterium angustum]PQJ68304.1 iron ABC transporter [Photobacterium angustum]